MYKYGQYCPIAKAMEILGDRWTIVIMRDLLTGTRHFNDLERGLPGISRGLLSDRLKRLEKAGLLEKVEHKNHRQRTEYLLTAAGADLQGVIEALLSWGVQWAFGAPKEEDLDPLLLLWWMCNAVRPEQLPPQRTVVQFDFTGAVTESYWLLLDKADPSICLTHPGFELNLLVTADIATFFQIWLGRVEFADALTSGSVTIDGIPTLVTSFPTWFSYSLAAAAVRAASPHK